MTNNVDTIVAFYRGKGLSDTAIAGILGNYQVESNDNPDAYNANEGAIGIEQWEGGRKRNLDNYATQVGSTDTNLTTQLQYAWQELTNSYPGALTALKAATTPAQAATIWQSQVEVSAPGSLSQRIADAESYFTNGLKSSTATSNTGGGATPTPGSTAATDQGINLGGDLSSLGKLFTGGLSSIPEAIETVGAPLTIISDSFKKMLWIFNPSNFVKAFLYVNGGWMVLLGMGMIIWGAGKERPA